MGSCVVAATPFRYSYEVCGQQLDFRSHTRQRIMAEPQGLALRHPKLLPSLACRRPIWHHAKSLRIEMANLLEYVGSVHIFLGPYRGNPIALYLKRSSNGCQISPKVYPWSEVMGVGETPNRAAADFEEKWKARGLSPEMYTGPSWEGGIKPEKPAPPKPAAPLKPAAAGAPAVAPKAAAPAKPNPSSEEAS